MSMHIGQSEIPPLVAVSQALVIHPQQKDGGIEVMNVHAPGVHRSLLGCGFKGLPSASNVVTVIIGAAIGDPLDGYHPCSRR